MMTTSKPEGFSLIELMVAMVLGLILTLGVLEIYLGSSKTSRLTNALARTQENVRFAADMLGRDIRELGNGCFLPSQSQSQLVTDLRINPPEPVSQGILGWEYSGANNTAPGDAYDLTGATTANLAGPWNGGAGTPVPATLSGPDRELLLGSDILYVARSRNNGLNGAIVTGAGGAAYNLNAASGIRRDEVVQITAGNCARAVRFYKNNAAAATAIVARGNDNNNGAGFPRITDLVDNPAAATQAELQNLQISVLRAKAFFVASDPNDPDDEPALFVQQLQDPNSGPITRELLSGVENMQILYGEGGRNGANRYVTANNVNDWDDVVSVRLALLMRSDDGVRDEKKTRSFNLAGTRLNTGTDTRARLVMMKTISLRNRLQ